MSVDGLPFDLALPPALRERLAAAYAEPHRRHHTRAHIDALLGGLREHADLATNPALIEAAIWFHDAIYDTRRGDNEALSAKWAERELSALAWPASAVERVAAMVCATQHHDAAAASLDPDTALFLDLDLSVLASPGSAYAAYSDGVRAEYAWVGADAYREGRGHVLRSFLNREAIYLTPELRAAWEDRARHNLARELAALQRGDRAR
jgi:predicted metal-dependent HD superfamily phosphohydrolase